MEEAIELIAGRDLREVSTNGLVIIAGKLGIPTENTNRNELIVAISTKLGKSAESSPE